MKYLLLGIMVVISGWALAHTDVQAQTGNTIVSRDAIGLRVSPNPEHYSPLQWYNANIKIKGSPQSLIVDGYEAVRDGRTVYVNAAKVARVKRCVGSTAICQSDSECPISFQTTTPFFALLNRLIQPVQAASLCVASPDPELYTNIYIISYNQEPEVATTDIFGQLLQYWKFNSDIKNCSNDLTKLCTDDVECGGGRLGSGVCQPTGVCSQTTTKACLLDSDCPTDEYCINKKSAIIRDVKRLSDLRFTKDRLENYNNTQGTYPTLSQGSYLKNRTISTWPSWQTTLRTTLGAGELAQDPINALTDCVTGSRINPYNPTTCWDEGAKKYSASADPLALPSGGGKYSYAYYYQYDANENTFRLCGIGESGFIQGRGIGATLCQVNKCATCDNRECGTDGCGHSCGTCSGTRVCYRHKCVASGTITTTEE